MRTRFIKTIIFNSLNSVNSIEAIVNDVSTRIANKGGKVVSIVPHCWGISPVHLIYDIIYDAETPLE